MRLILVCLPILAACAASGPVPTGPDSYMLSAKSYALGASIGDAKANAYREANEFCAKQGKSFMVQGGQDRGGSPGRFPEAEVRFMCLDKGDRDLKRPDMRPAPNTIVEVQK